MAFNLEKEILEVTEYKSGYTAEDNEYVISASMIGNEMLQNYLSIIFGPKKQTKITDPTLGTIMHAGLEKLLPVPHTRPEPDDYRPIGKEYSMSMKLKNGWILSGTADYIVRSEPGVYEIHDFKFAKTYTMKMFKKEIQNHNYTKQLRALKMLFVDTTTGPIWDMGEDAIFTVKLYCDFLLKDASLIKNEKLLNQIEIPPPNINYDWETEIIAQTNMLQEYIENGKTPPKCKDTWIRKINGRVVAVKCQYYCSQAENCPYYDTMGTTTMIDFANWEPK